jgi:hypothetical protein
VKAPKSTKSKVKNKVIRVSAFSLPEGLALRCCHSHQPMGKAATAKPTAIS